MRALTTLRDELAHLGCRGPINFVCIMQWRPCSEARPGKSLCGVESWEALRLIPMVPLFKPCNIVSRIQISLFRIMHLRGPPFPLYNIKLGHGNLNHHIKRTEIFHGYRETQFIWSNNCKLLNGYATIYIYMQCRLN